MQSQGRTGRRLSPSGTRPQRHLQHRAPDTMAEDARRKLRSHEGPEPQEPGQVEGHQPSPEAGAIPAEANIVVELGTRITDAARHCATNQGLKEKVLEMLVGSLVQMYPPEAVATELLSALWAKDHQPGQLDSLYDAICELLRELHPDSDAGLEKLGLKFVTLPDALETCQVTLTELGKELGEWTDSIPSRMEEKQEAAGEAATLVALRAEDLVGLDVPRWAYILIPPLPSRGSKADRLWRVREVLNSIARALPENDGTQAKIYEIADELESASLDL
jgi:hypothetical protein